MEILVWMGGAATLIGLVGLIYCIRQALKARSQGLDEEAMRGVLQRLVVLNMTSLAISALGLIMVVMGIFLG